MRIQSTVLTAGKMLQVAGAIILKLPRLKSGSKVWLDGENEMELAGQSPLPSWTISKLPLPGPVSSKGTARERPGPVFAATLYEIFDPETDRMVTQSKPTGAGPEHPDGNVASKLPDPPLAEK
jgi:hypothetical protein